MKIYKCIFYRTDLFRIQELFQEKVGELQIKKPHEMSEVIVYRLFLLYALQKRVHSKVTSWTHPNEPIKMSFNLPEVLTLKYCLMDRIKTPGLSKIFMQLDSKIHPAIQLEI